MSWLGVAPFKKFNAPFCTSIRAARGRPPLEAHHIASPPAALHWGPTIANILNSQAHVAFLRCRYVIATLFDGNQRGPDETERQMLDRDADNVRERQD